MMSSYFVTLAFKSPRNILLSITEGAMKFYRTVLGFKVGDFPIFFHHLVSQKQDESNLYDQCSVPEGLKDSEYR